MGPFRRRLRVNLALQGGGAHGAFTWGVLDRLLQEPNLDFAWLSATSAGAVNAAAVASGLATGDREVARQTLRNVWDGVEQAGVPDLLRLNPFWFGLTRAATLTNVSPMFSPYDFNPLGFDPLRRVLEAHLAFDRIRAASPVELLIAATDVETGRARLFRRRELTVEAVLASACLPTLHHAVEIDGRAYWDGGFSANPDLVTLAAESPVEDTIIVQLNATETQGHPRTARDIAGRVNDITFNQPMLRDIELICAAQDTPLGWLKKRSRLARIKRHRFHLIEAGRYTESLSAESKLKPDKALLAYLHTAGSAEASKWLERCRADLGRRSTVDLKRRYLTPRRERAPDPDAEPGREGRVAVSGTKA